MEINDILKQAVDKGASDVHLVVGNPPMMRVRGNIVPIDGMAAITAKDSERLIFSILYDDQRTRFEKDYELDCSTVLTNIGRFRVNVFLQQNGVEAVLRVIPTEIPTPEEISLSKAIVSFTDLDKGLVLVTGPTGSGKSTTLASLIDVINNKRQCNIITIEDPIEFVHKPNKSVIRQRELGRHTHSYAAALKFALRQDPDVILIGEMRDLETISAALTIAETGHLVFSTLHTNDSVQTVDRIIDVFPPHQQQQVRVQLASVLKGVVSQVLLPRSDATGRIAAREVLVVTGAVSNLIRSTKTHQIYSAIETGGQYGMIPLDKSLVELVKNARVSMDDAASKASNPSYVRSGGRATARTV